MCMAYSFFVCASTFLLVQTLSDSMQESDRKNNEKQNVSKREEVMRLIQKMKKITKRAKT